MSAVHAWWQAGAAIMLAATPALATLGRPIESVERDRVHISAKAAAPVVARAWRTQSLATPEGGTVREYAGTDGVVFAVTWQGPARPDLRQLLGDNFQTMQDARPRVPPIARRAQLSVVQGDLVVRSAGHPGGFFGYAYLKSRVPQGFAPEELR